MGSIGAGSEVAPVSHSSTADAADRPSAIAQTISDWPRPASPATNTPGTVDMNAASRAMLPRPSISTPSWASRPSGSGPVKPMASSTSWAGISRAVPSIGVNRPVDQLDVDELERLHLAGLVADEAHRAHREDPVAALLVGRGRAVDHRPGRPRVGVRPLVRGPRQDLELGHRRRALPVGRAETVGTGVAAADDDDVLAVGADRHVVGLVLRVPVGVREIVHRLQDAAELATGHGQVAADRGADGEHHGVVPRLKV